MAATTTRYYRHVLIDLDNTLLDFAVCEAQILTAMAHEYGFSPRTREGQALVVPYRQINSELWQQLERGEISGPELRIQRFRRLLTHLEPGAAGPLPKPEMLNQQFIQRLSRCGELVPTAAAVVQKIAPVVIITNGFPEVQYPRLERCGLKPHIAATFISGEIGFSKPDPRFFNAVLAALGNPDPNECLVVGDSLTSDIAGGNAMGMDTVWFDRSATLGEAATAGADRITPTRRITRLSDLPALVDKGLHSADI